MLNDSFQNVFGIFNDALLKHYKLKTCNFQNTQNDNVPISL